MGASTNDNAVTRINPGAFSRAAIENEAGEVEVRLSRYGNWFVQIRRPGETKWTVACQGQMERDGVLAFVPSENQGEIRFGALRVLRGARRVFVDDQEVELSKKELEVLLILISDPYRVFTKEELMKSVWGYKPASTTRTLNSHATRLRGKLAAAGALGLIKNRWGVGYRLTDGSPADPDDTPSGGSAGGHLVAAS